jgi:hypothetical protein
MEEGCLKTGSAAGGVVLYVDGVVHGGGGSVGFFVGGDVGLMLHIGADVVEAFRQDFLAEGAISNLNINPRLSAIVWWGKF